MLRLTVFLGLTALVAALPTFPIENQAIDLFGDWRVVGGSDAVDGAHPFVISLRSISTDSHSCGGSIIDQNYILSAAHCLVGRTTSNTVVVVGTNQLTTGGTRYPASAIIVHANYNANTIQNDIGLIRVAQAISFGLRVSTIPLGTETIQTGRAVLIGWGRTYTGGPLPNNLQHLYTEIITHQQCQNTWGSQVNPTQICAYTIIGEGACNGDSGGPLILESSGEQAGIVSFGVACAQGYPDVYTRVSSFSTWINNNVS